MEFRKEFEKSKIQIGDKVEESVVEIRYDPLTLQTSRIVRKNIPISAIGDFEDEIANSKNWCPFCNERVEDMAARDPEIMKGAIWKRGECLAFSNIMPYSRYSLILRIAERHYLPLSEFKNSHFFDAFKLIQEFLNKLPNQKFYVSIGMNYLKSAGSSVMHPHIQLIVSETSTDFFARLEWSAYEFMELHGKDYWSALVEEEKGGERYIGRTKKTDWLAAFAPKGFLHFVGIPEETDFALMSEDQLSGFSEGITKILKFYESRGFNAFNFTFFCGDRIGNHFRTNFHIVARTPFSRYYWNDVFFSKMFHDESITFFSPEDYASELRTVW
ncbi:MAG: hypothetical protein QXY19_04325 [Archaeoglobaceae archaeon]